ncbi:MAG TPA: 3-deoxy-manno-octulosonate cytidylyltransferase [Vicinamibacteria bacterium]|nr:3-deoxy-manno-octulosonate cytidylyltransferase [Vicinamibacteria bacterium]
MAIAAIIPARYGASRLPGKPLSDIHGRPMIQHVYERVRRARGLDRVLVATDDARIAEVVKAFGGEALMTSAAHKSGSDRLAEAAGAIAADVVVGVQGDEPMIDPRAVEAVLRPFAQDASVEACTVCTPLRDAEEMLSPHVVKVVVDARGRALYFSRSPIPHLRGQAAGEAAPRHLARRHLGLYAWRRQALLRFAAFPPSALEEAEGLEQLRALEHGMAMQVVDFDGDPGVAVDTPADLERVRALLAPTGARPGQ